jgi:hypothetical protein
MQHPDAHHGQQLGGLQSAPRFPRIELQKLGDTVCLRYVQRSSDRKRHQKTRSTHLCRFVSLIDDGHRDARQGMVRRRE